MMRINAASFFTFASLMFVGACADGTAGGGPAPGGGDDVGTPAAVCGDGTCETSEIGVCDSDCAGTGSGSGSGSGSATSCGNFACETGEDATTCPADCTGGGGGNPGTLDCNAQDTQLACFACLLDPSGCSGAVTETACATCLGGGAPTGTGCEGGAPDGTCNPTAGEDATTCPFDCM